MEWYTAELKILANSQEDANKKRDEIVATMSKYEAGASSDLLLNAMLEAWVILLAEAFVTPKPQNTDNAPSVNKSFVASHLARKPRPKFEHRKSQDEKDKNNLDKTPFKLPDPASMALWKTIYSMSEQELSDTYAFLNIEKEGKQMEDHEQIRRLELIIEKYGVITKNQLQAVVKNNK